MNNFFTIAIDTCNHEKWIERCLNSCLYQKYDNFEVILVDAISTDKTFELAKKYLDKFKNFKVVQNETRLPQVANFKVLNDLAKENSIVVSIDGDDWFKNTKVLQKLNEVYNSGEVWMTYGTYEEFPFRNVSDFYRSYSELVIKENSFRKERWYASHLRTWRKELFDKIKIEDLKLENGNWLDTTGDQAIMLPMLEMSAEKSRYISDVMYVYNVSNTTRDTAGNESRQIELSNYIRAKRPYEPLEKL